MWDAFWFAPASSRNLAVARILLAGTALWIVLSRFDLPSVIEYPAMWSGVSASARLRFGIGLPLSVERALFVLLHLTLVLTIAGVATRISAFASALLLYHFAPFETVFWTTNPYLRGLTIPTLGLFALSFARERDEHWPIAFVRLLLAEMYFFAGYAKLVTSGVRWASGDNIRRWLLLLDQTYGGGSHAGARMAGWTYAPAAIGWAAIVFELIFPLALVSKPARRVLVPLAIIFHLANVWLFHIFFQDIALLLLFIDWKRRDRDAAV